jgi:hypothetical protein
MTCKEALALGRRGERTRAAIHLEACADCRTKLDYEERALAQARASLVIQIPIHHVDRVVRAALTAAPPPVLLWWRLALPIAWRAAAALNLAGAIVFTWTMMSRASAPATPPLPRPVDSTSSGAATTTFDVDNLLDNEVKAMFTDDLGLGGGTP